MAEDMACREAVEYLKGQDFEVNIGALEDVQAMYYLMFASFFCVCFWPVSEREWTVLSRTLFMSFYQVLHSGSEKGIELSPYGYKKINLQ